MKEEEVEVGGLQLAHAPLLHHLIAPDRDQGFFAIFIMLRPGFRTQTQGLNPCFLSFLKKLSGRERGDCLM